MLRVVLALGLLAILVPLLPVEVVADNAVVGTGSAVSCTEAAFNTALATAQTNGGGTITFDCGGPATIIFTTTKTISNSNTVIVDGGHQITLDGNDTRRHFRVVSEATLDLRNITLQNGRIVDDDGGAVYVEHGLLKVTSSTFRNNRTVDDGGGGAIAVVLGELEVTSSTFEGNISNDLGGAILETYAATTITTSTFTGNSARSDGGAIATQNNSTLVITSSTLSGNMADDQGGAIDKSGGNVTVAGSIVAGNTAPTRPNCAGTITSQGSNLSDDTSCNFNQANDIQDSVNVNLGPLQENGGPTETMLLAADSDALDTSVCLTSEDQRGYPRPSGLGCDIGAVEVQTAATYPLCVNPYTGRVMSPLSGVCPPRHDELDVPEIYPATFCIDAYTGALSFTATCNPPRQAHLMPDDGDLLTCVNRYTGANRWVEDHAVVSGE